MYGFGQVTTCPTVDPMYPTGCPAGYTLQELYYVPNSEVTNVTASTPGAIPLPNPSYTGSGSCLTYACMNSSMNTPSGVSDQQCYQNNQMIQIAVAAAGLLLLPGWLKLLAPVVAFFLPGTVLPVCPGSAD